ncbi:acyl-CoA synthetase [Bordetella pertussis]|uniref:Acyl-CoA synthetases (AMP-forming)/AMP-acid ligases n=1 Tax=Bordetella pertussis (strain ATCC 9797 / DSM 5571 / CCUG 30873 / LMG 14455 / NCTC 10739 / 18323) TaxID=568706 RepID=A0A0T7CSL5_BORP1|nr:acyl-CoA synthetase [Bordetella pertussis]AZR86064.1 acetyl-CoA synthetase [Bordetella pertussis]PNO98859.1 acetyl-CoA synthetase [Bordetella pertussis 18323]UEB57544.1 acyl-CoA synthetase [Bordetella pertussis]CCJ64539.1 Acyl-CoA synthetases (AMP-forming)/AMP-acid ligases [Bordetella pertussis 18323]
MTPEYTAALERFDWRAVRGALGWGEAHAVDLAHAIIDRHRDSGRTALVFIDQQGCESRHSYAELAEQSDRAANLLARLGVRPGDRVAGLLPRGPEILVAMLAAIKIGAIYVPIFTGFKRDAIEYRLGHSGARVVFAHAALRGQLSAVLPGQARCVTVAAGAADTAAGDIDFAAALREAEPRFAAQPREREDIAALIYTSGSTGRPKGGAIAVNFLAAVWPYLTYGADMRADDVVWPTGDPGWGYGFVCYLGALAMGATIVSLAANPTPEVCLDVLARQRVSNFATTPTLLRGVMALGMDAVRARPNAVRAISSCGEPLNGEVVEFFQQAWGRTPMDHFGATEYGLPVGNFNAVAVPAKAGSMGLPFPGYEIAVLDDAGQPLAGAHASGWLAKRRSADRLYWSHYWDDAGATAELERGEWIVTGDLAHRDAEGYYWFDGRAGDMIKSAGYRIGPFEVESALLAHGAVAEAAVVGVPDALRGELVKAYIVLLPGHAASPRLAEEIQLFVKTHCGAHLYPRIVEFVPDLPKTDTGKIQRFALRQRA